MLFRSTVDPGFGGQAFLSETVSKVKELAQLRLQAGLQFEIEVDAKPATDTTMQPIIQLCKQ